MKFNISFTNADRYGNKILGETKTYIIDTTSYEKALGIAFDLKDENHFAGNYVECKMLEEGNNSYKVYTEVETYRFNPLTRQFEKTVKPADITIVANSKEEAQFIYDNNFKDRNFFPNELMAYGIVVNDEGYAKWLNSTKIIRGEICGN